MRILLPFKHPTHRVATYLRTPEIGSSAGRRP
jgi:hypothetical protein